MKERNALCADTVLSIFVVHPCQSNGQESTYTVYGDMTIFPLDHCLGPAFPLSWAFRFLLLKLFVYQCKLGFIYCKLKICNLKMKGGKEKRKEEKKKKKERGRGGEGGSEGGKKGISLQELYLLAMLNLLNANKTSL